MIWYKNSILASIFSLAGCSLVLAAIYELTKAQNSELSIPEAIGAIAVGLLLAFIGNRISAHKAEKKRAQPTKASTSTGADFAQSRHTSTYTTRQVNMTSAAGTVENIRPVKVPIVVAGVLFILVPLFTYLAKGAPTSPGYLDKWGPEDTFNAVMFILLAVASFHSLSTQAVSIFYTIGFLGLFAPSFALVFDHYASAQVASDPSHWYTQCMLRSFVAVTYLFMALLSFLAKRKSKSSSGGIVCALWWLPALMQLIGACLQLEYDFVFRRFQLIGWIGLFRLFNEYAYLATIQSMCTFLAIFLTGLSFCRICKKSETSNQPFTSYSQAIPQYEAPVPPVQPQPQPQTVQPQPASAPAEPAAASVNQQEAEKMRAAYKDLLDMGIITAEEYEQKIKKLH